MAASAGPGDCLWLRWRGSSSLHGEIGREILDVLWNCSILYQEWNEVLALLKKSALSFYIVKRVGYEVRCGGRCPSSSASRGAVFSHSPTSYATRLGLDSAGMRALTKGDTLTCYSL